MSGQRGSKLLKLLDRYAGYLILAIMAVLLHIKSWLNNADTKEPQTYLLICFGAIGDLIILTEAARIQWGTKRVVLACSSSNLPCAMMYQDFYQSIELIDTFSILDVHRVCKVHKIDVIYDSTQWANIGPLQVGLARLLNRELAAIGFQAQSSVRNYAYTRVVQHSANVHEVLNFMNLLSPLTIYKTNDVLPTVLSRAYQRHPCRATHKVLFHMWPSGARACLKEWPESYWIELAHYFHKLQYQIYLSGAPADKARNTAFIAKLGLDNLNNIAGLYDLTKISDFIASEIECAICVNTGILHLVASLGVPLIGLHGPTNPLRWGPLGSNSVALLPASGRFAYLHYGFEYPEDDKEAYALDRLSVGQVTSAFELLNKQES